MKSQSKMLTLLVFSGLAPVFGAQVYVCPSNPPPYNTIQGGVNAASSGSTILVCAATYREQIKIATPGLVLQAQGTVTVVPPPSQTVPSYGFQIMAPTVTIDGFAITGFKDSSSSAGILATGSASAPLTGVRLKNNLIYGNCNGIFLKNTKNTLVDSNNASQNPYPDPSSVVPQKGIPPPPGPQPFPPICIVPSDSHQPPGADGYGIQSASGREVAITRNDVEQNGESGIQLLSDAGGSEVSVNNLFQNSGPFTSGVGSIDIRGSSGAAEQIEVANNTLDRGINGVNLVNSDHVQVSWNKINHMSEGINLTDSNRNTISSNDTRRNTAGIFLTGQNNYVNGNNASDNTQTGIVVSVDGCDQPLSQVYNPSSNNTFESNLIQRSGFIDVQDFSSLSGRQCGSPPVEPPCPASGTYTPCTLDFWRNNTCRTSDPTTVCSTQ